MRIIIEESKKGFKREAGCSCPVESSPGAAVVRLTVLDTCATHRAECARCDYNTPLGGDCGFRYCPRYEERMDAQS
jgi:hypothetical protein